MEKEEELRSKSKLRQIGLTWLRIRKKKESQVGYKLAIYTHPMVLNVPAARVLCRGKA